MDSDLICGYYNTPPQYNENIFGVIVGVTERTHGGFSWSIFEWKAAKLVPRGRRRMRKDRYLDDYIPLRFLYG
jgi:hypothetical protein